MSNEYNDIWDSWINGNQGWCREKIKHKPKQWIMRMQKYLIEVQDMDPTHVRKELERMVDA